MMGVCLLMSVGTVLLASTAAVPGQVPEAARSHYELGVAAKEAENYAKAITELSQAIELHKGSEDARWVLAWVYATQGEKPLAAQQFWAVMRLAPDTDRAREAAAALGRMGLAGWPEYLQDAKLLAGVQIRLAPDDGMPQVLVPAGELAVGGGAGFGAEATRAPHVEAFWMDLHEVTYAQFCRFLNDVSPEESKRIAWTALAGEPQKKYNTGFAYGPKLAQQGGGYVVEPGFEHYPVAWVSWGAAMAYAEWAGRTLPTEAQWEYAARGGKRRQTFPWGEAPVPPPGSGSFRDERFRATWPKLGGIEGYDDGYVAASPVCSFSPNAFCLFDMEGNVTEWCADSNDSGARAVRGGAWGSNLEGLRLTWREWRKADYAWDGTGFRCAAAAGALPAPPR